MNQSIQQLKKFVDEATFPLTVDVGGVPRTFETEEEVNCFLSGILYAIWIQSENGDFEL